MLLFFLLQLMQQAPPKEPWPPVQAGSVPDVVVFLLDDVGARDIELLSAETPSRTPEIDALADQGMVFENGYAQPMCAPSRYSLYLSEWEGLTGGFACHPNTNGLGPGATADTLPSGIDSLPKAMEGAGYRTALFGRWGLGTWLADDPDSQDYAYAPLLWGFETWHAGIPDGSEGCGGTGYSDWLRVDDGNVSIETEYHTTVLVEEFVAWWAATPAPRFAMVAFQAAHDPFHWPPASAMPAGWTQPSNPTPRKKYEAMIQSADLALGLMLDEIDLESTLVVLLGDNGTPQSVAPNGYNGTKVKFSTYEGGVRVPFIVAGLGSDVGVSAQPVSEVDLIPTFMDLAGCVTPVAWDGQSVLPALDGNTLGRQWVYVQRGDSGECAVIEAQWKLREEADLEQWLYDLSADPFENSPIDPDAPGYEDVVTRLRAEMAQI